MEDKIIVDQKIIIISNIKLQIIFPKHFVVGSHEYELRYCSCTYNEHNVFFNGNIHSRHGKLFSKWLYQDCSDKITAQSDTYPELSHENRNYTLVYVRVDEFDEKSYKNKFLQMLGVQVRVQCDVHKLSLIISCQKTKCGCNRQHQYFCCSIAT